MTTQPDSPATTADLDDQQVAAYLREHPDFLVRHEDLLATLEVPHRPGGDAVSLIERQVTQLRRRNERLDQRLAELMSAARDNERVGRRLVGLGRGLLEADSLDSVLALVREAILNEFGADDATLLLIQPNSGAPADIPPAHCLAADDDRVAAFTGFLEAGEPQCGRLTDDQLDALFGERAERVASAAIVPLQAGRLPGMIAMASRDPDRFGPAMGTLFLGQLGELVSAGVARHAG